MFLQLNVMIWTQQWWLWQWWLFGYQKMICVIKHLQPFRRQSGIPKLKSWQSFDWKYFSQNGTNERISFHFQTRCNGCPCIIQAIRSWAAQKLHFPRFYKVSRQSIPAFAKHCLTSCFLCLYQVNWSSGAQRSSFPSRFTRYCDNHSPRSQNTVFTVGFLCLIHANWS